MTEPFSITTQDPRFDAHGPVIINGFRYAPAAEQIIWLSSEPPKDGSVIYGHTWQPYRWKAYSPKSEQWRRLGIKGRWQAMNEYAGWDNAQPPDEWATEDAINAHRAIRDDAHG